MSYHLCDAGVTLRNQINRRFKNRDKRSDGWIGDASHQASTTSDHNPDWNAGGVVRAIDIDADLHPKVGNHKAASELAEQLRCLGKSGKDRRISYVIFNRQIASPREDWRWRPYTGSNTHEHHIHCSFTPAGDQNGAKFDLPILKVLGR